MQLFTVDLHVRGDNLLEFRAKSVVLAVAVQRQCVVLLAALERVVRSQKYQHINFKYIVHCRIRCSAGDTTGENEFMAVY